VNKRSETTTAYLQIHFAVLLFGLTAIFGKLIVFDGIALVWHRLWIACLGLLVIPGVFKGILQIPKKDLLRFIGIGVIVCLHWLAFYGSIKLGNNASITLACLATSTIFVSFLEPLITKSKFSMVESLMGLFVVIGIVLVLDVGSFYYSAIGVGLISAVLAALFSVLNKKYLGNYKTLSVSTIELFSGFVFLSLIIPIYEGGFELDAYSLFREDLYSSYSLFGYYIHSSVYLVILGLLCTSLAYALALASLKVLTAFTSNLAVNLEPIYGILLAIPIFKENLDLTFNFYLGTGIILITVLLHPFFAKIAKKRVFRFLH
jgi:drug/metabolite transporter (DMT)-like permease